LTVIYKLNANSNDEDGKVIFEDVQSMNFYYYHFAEVILVQNFV